MLDWLLEKIAFRKDPVQYCRKKGVTIGRDCQIMGTVFPFGTEPYLVRIGNHVRINAGVQFITHDGGVWVLREIGKYGPSLINKNSFDGELKNIDLFGTIQIGDNVQIGSNVLILPNTKIGNNVIVGAGAVVTKDIPDGSIAVGIPAKVIESIDDYYEKNCLRFLHTKDKSAQEKETILKECFSLYDQEEGGV